MPPSKFRRNRLDSVEIRRNLLQKQPNIANCVETPTNLVELKMQDNDYFRMLYQKRKRIL